MPLDDRPAARRSISPQPVTIFLSSPGDVVEERRLVEDVVQRRLAKDPLLHGRVTFDVVSWDDPDAPTPMLANLTPQDAITRFRRRPADCDIVVVILWSRLGTHLDTRTHRKPDGSPYRSGTEWEYEDAAGADPPPDILLYRRKEKPRIDIDDPDADAKRAQYESVNAFLARFRNPDGSFAGSVTDYPAPDALTQRLTSDLTGLLANRLGAGDPAAGERLAALERIADDALAAKQALELQVRDLSEQSRLKDETIRSLNSAINALTARTEAGADPTTIETALRHLASGNAEDAMAIFRAVLDGKAEEAERKEAERDEARREAVAAARHLGALSVLNDTRGALSAYRRAAQLDPDDTWTWLFIAELELQGGTVDRASEAAKNAGELAQLQGNERDQFASMSMRGDVLVAQGNLTAALESYRAGLSIRERLAAADAGNAVGQRDLAVSHWKLAGLDDRPKVHWREVVRIFEALETQGRLAPVDRQWLPIARENLAATGVVDGEER